MSLDASGDRNGDFSVVRMTDPEAGTHEVCACNHFISRKVRTVSEIQSFQTNLQDLVYYVCARIMFEVRKEMSFYAFRLS